MKKLHAGVGLLLGGFLALALSAQDAAGKRESPTVVVGAVVVGTFDSRAVAVAYVRSDEFQNEMAALRAELKRAQAAGDEKTVQELEALGPAMGKRIHEQGFGAAPVDDIIARIEERLPDIAREAGVDVIVSKWVLAYRSPAAELVDVTDRMAAEFDPDEETLKTIRELLATEPVPLDQLGDDD